MVSTLHYTDLFTVEKLQTYAYDLFFSWQGPFSVRKWTVHDTKIHFEGAFRDFYDPGYCDLLSLKYSDGPYQRAMSKPRPATVLSHTEEEAWFQIHEEANRPAGGTWAEDRQRW